MIFRIGQPVICIKPDGWRDLVCGETGPTFHQRLTIRDIERIPAGLFLRFEEIVNPCLRYREREDECLFSARWFRPVVERETDISFAHEILREASNKVEEPAC